MLLRLAFIAAALIGAALLFIYAAFLAVIFVPIVLLVLYILRRKGLVRWTTVDMRTGRPQGNPHTRPGARPPVIDHDPNDVTIERSS